MAKLQSTKVRGALTVEDKQVSLVGHTHNASEVTGIQEYMEQASQDMTVYNTTQLGGHDASEYVLKSDLENKITEINNIIEKPIPGRSYTISINKGSMPQRFKLSFIDKKTNSVIKTPAKTTIFRFITENGDINVYYIKSNYTYHLYVLQDKTGPYFNKMAAHDNYDGEINFIALQTKINSIEVAFIFDDDEVRGERKTEDEIREIYRKREELIYNIDIKLNEDNDFIMPTNSNLTYNYDDNITVSFNKLEDFKPSSGKRIIEFDIFDYCKRNNIRINDLPGRYDYKYIHFLFDKENEIDLVEDIYLLLENGNILRCNFKMLINSINRNIVGLDYAPSIISTDSSSIGNYDTKFIKLWNAYGNIYNLYVNSLGSNYVAYFISLKKDTSLFQDKIRNPYNYGLFAFGDGTEGYGDFVLPHVASGSVNAKFKKGSPIIVHPNDVTDECTKYILKRSEYLRNKHGLSKQTINGVPFELYKDITIPASTLSTPRNINGVAFDGSKDITITAQANGGNADTLDGLDSTAFVKTTDVANEPNKIPRFNSNGHLVYPDGHEEWIE